MRVCVCCCFVVFKRVYIFIILSEIFHIKSIIWRDKICFRSFKSRKYISILFRYDLFYFQKKGYFRRINKRFFHLLFLLIKCCCKQFFQPSALYLFEPKKITVCCKCISHGQDELYLYILINIQCKTIILRFIKRPKRKRDLYLNL